MNEFKGIHRGPLHVYPSSAHAETDFAIESDEEGGVAWVIKEDDAKLFAAAPEMFAALKEIVKDVQAVHEACGIPLPYWFEACEAALKKATSISN